MKAAAHFLFLVCALIPPSFAHCVIVPFPSCTCVPLGGNRYVVLSNMLSLSQINPFDSQEAKVYVSR